MKADLHIHSTGSDGRHSLDYLLESYSKKNFDIVAITDHYAVSHALRDDNVLKMKEEKYNIKIVIGMEAVSEVNNEWIDLLCYFNKNSDFSEKINNYLYGQTIFIKDLNNKIKKIMKEKNIDIPDIDYSLLDPYSYTPILMEIVKRTNLSLKETRREFFTYMKGLGIPKEYQLTTEELIEEVHKSKGLIFMAHPLQFKNDTILKAIQLGIDGIEAESKLSHHIFIASELRKEDFFKLPINERNRLLKINIKENYSIGEYINFKCKSSILDSLNNLITNLLNEIKKDISKDIFDMDYMWQQISSFIDQLIVNFLDSPIKNSQLKNSPCLFIDLMLVKDEINFLNKIKNDKLIQQKLVQSKIDKLNTIFKEINNEILSVYNQDVQKTFRIIHSGETEAHCRYYSLAKRHLNLDDDDYMVNCLCFIEITGYAFDLDNSLYLTNTLNLKISYRNKIIYSISEDHRNRLLETQKDILSIIDINKNYRYIG